MSPRRLDRFLPRAKGRGFTEPGCHEAPHTLYRTPYRGGRPSVTVVSTYLTCSLSLLQEHRASRILLWAKAAASFHFDTLLLYRPLRSSSLTPSLRIASLSLVDLYSGRGDLYGSTLSRYLWPEGLGNLKTIHSPHLVSNPRPSGLSELLNVIEFPYLSDARTWFAHVRFEVRFIRVLSILLSV
jgi:hypothetical protein